MRLLLVALLSLTAISGCLSGSTPETTEQPTYVAEPPLVDAGEMLATLKDFAESNPIRRENLPTHLSARDDLATMFTDAGLEVWRQNFTNGIDQENIVGIKWGEDRSTWVVIGGHYDTITTDCLFGGPMPCGGQEASQGMYDDGSGTIMTVALAQAWANVSTPVTLVFVAFDGEERGTEGSGAFLEAVLAEESPYGAVSVHAMLDLDMIGLNWPAINAPINFIDNSAALQSYMRELQANLSIPEEMVVYKGGLQLGSSDYRHFWQAGIPAAFMISDFEEIGVPVVPAATPFGAYPFWHVADTWETMVAMGGGTEANMQTGFQLSLDVATHLIWFMAVSGEPLMP